MLTVASIEIASYRLGRVTSAIQPSHCDSAAPNEAEISALCDSETVEKMAPVPAAVSGNTKALGVQAAYLLISSLLASIVFRCVRSSTSLIVEAAANWIIEINLEHI
jgi:hypothetical protein